jgi:hypothetical protein
MIRPDYLDLCRQVLDHAIIDCDELPCGTVDDVELVLDRDGRPAGATALLVGPGAWGPRLPALLAWAVAWVIGTRCTRVPWGEIAEVGEKLKLRSRASTLGLGLTDRRWGLRVAKLPGSERTGK